MRESSGRRGASALVYVVALAALVLLPLVISNFFVGILASVYIWAIAGIGMMVLLGYSGQVSIGHSAFLAIGAYGEALLIKYGVPFPASLLIIAAAAFVLGVVVGLPSLRFSGLYLAMATFAFAFIVEAAIGGVEFTGGRGGLSVDDIKVFGRLLAGDYPMYYLTLGIAVAVFWLTNNIISSKTGRAWQTIRDSEIAAAGLGIDTARYKTFAFAFSAAVTGIAGALMAHKIGYLSPDGFTLQQSIELLILVVVGGIGSMMGAVYGALFIVLVPVALSVSKDQMPTWLAELPGLEAGLFGAILVLVILFQPQGINGVVVSLWRKLRNSKEGQS